MRVIKAYPPNFRQLAAAFPVRGRRDVIFTYGDTIYNPGGINISDWLMAHERVHARQQGERPDTWWTQYVAFKPFRLEQEVEAHRAEARAGGDVEYAARRLSSPLYGGLITLDEARKLLAA